MSACRRKADISDYDAVSARASADVSNLYLRCGRRTKKSFYYNYLFLDWWARELCHRHTETKASRKVRA